MGRNLIIAAILLIIYAVIQLTLLTSDRFELPDGVSPPPPTSSSDSTPQTETPIRTPDFVGHRDSGEELVVFVCIEAAELNTAQPRTDICIITGNGSGELNLTRDLGHENVTSPRINSQGEIVFSCWGGELGEERSICYLRHDGSELHVLDLPYESHVFDAPDMSDQGEIIFACGLKVGESFEDQTPGWQVCLMSDVESAWEVVSRNDYSFLSGDEMYAEEYHSAPAISESGLVVYKCILDAGALGICDYRHDSGGSSRPLDPVNGVDLYHAQLSVNDFNRVIYTCFDDPHHICGSARLFGETTWQISAIAPDEVQYGDPYIQNGVEDWGVFRCGFEICLTDVSINDGYELVTDLNDDVSFSDPVISEDLNIYAICAELGAPNTICLTSATGGAVSIFGLRNLAVAEPYTHERLVDVSTYRPVSTPGDVNIDDSGEDVHGHQVGEGEET